MGESTLLDPFALSTCKVKEKDSWKSHMEKETRAIVDIRMTTLYEPAYLPKQGSPPYLT
jgi:hypothetical protein